MSASNAVISMVAARWHFALSASIRQLPSSSYRSGTQRAGSWTWTPCLQSPAKVSSTVATWMAAPSCLELLPPTILPVERSHCRLLVTLLQELNRLRALWHQLEPGSRNLFASLHDEVQEVNIAVLASVTA